MAFLPLEIAHLSGKEILPFVDSVVKGIGILEPCSSETIVLEDVMCANPISRKGSVGKCRVAQGGVAKYSVRSSITMHTNRVVGSI